MELLNALSRIFPANRLKTSLLDRTAFAGDAGFYELIPQAVVQPVDEKEIGLLFELSTSKKVPLVFRAAGTSLSGQSITNGILVDISRYWRKAWVQEKGSKIRVQPGIIGAHVNHTLKPYSRKIGPDPASINAAMMGGILANNASGMCCGVANNAYHTVDTIRFMLFNGAVFDTAIPEDYIRFGTEAKVLCETLCKLRSELFAQPDLVAKIRRKYRMKNTVGYSLNAFVDYEHPLDIFAHLLIGSEGTLGFICEAVLQTLPDQPCKAAAMLYFPDISSACHAIPFLKETGAEALEMMDRSALRSVENMAGLPDFFKFLPVKAAALLCEYQAADPETLQKLLDKASVACTQISLLHPVVFTSEEKIRQFYWKMRKGMFPSVGAVRQRGSSVLLEDIAIPVPSLAEALADLENLFLKYGYLNAIIFGHAKEGNIHFVITQKFDTPAEIDRYDRFMREVVHLVLKKYDGALKAEHGTGRNMAPFVEAEWGGEAYVIMKKLKAAADPDDLLNPGVIINSDDQAHIRHLKNLPPVEEEVDKCIECGFCEHHCPSKDITLTPRQRIQVRRHLKNMESRGDKEEYEQLLQEYQYGGLDTCATDGLCEQDCPVEINTGELVKRLRREQHSPFANKVALQVAGNFAFAEKAVRFALHAGNTINSVFGKKTMPLLTDGLRKIMPSLPRWWPELSNPPKRIYSQPVQPAYVYLSACIQRMMGEDAANGSVQQKLLEVSERAGIDVYLPKSLEGHCCGQAFSSKGYLPAAVLKQEQLINHLWELTQEGKLPVICDFTSCTYTLLGAGAHVSPMQAGYLSRLKIMDSIKFLEEIIVPRLEPIQKKNTVVLHPGCATTKLQLEGSMKLVAKRYAHEVVVPYAAGCCGMAGDRGFLFPELTHAATATELEEVQAVEATGYYASAKTCEMALTHHSGKPYQHLVYLVEETTR